MASLLQIRCKGWAGALALEQEEDRAGHCVEGWEHLLSLPALASSVHIYLISTQDLEVDEIWD